MNAMTPEELAEWDRRTSESRDALDGLADPVWRVANLYQCLTEDGQAVHYVPTPEQRLVIWCILVRGWQRILIPKARQLGMSLTLAILCADGVAFRAGFASALVDKTASDAEKKMREKVLFAFDRLPPAVLEQLETVRRNDGELTIREVKNPGAPGSTFQAGVNFRGGTVEFLWVSEWGAIQDTDRARSRAIKSGSLPAVERAENGVCVVETTWRGGLDGELGPLVREALDVPDEDKGRRSWRILFFGWWGCPLYRQSHGYIDAESAGYFDKLEAAGVVLEQEQRLWYAEKRRTARSNRMVREEYPSLVHECWENIPQGSIYGELIEMARAQGRICDFHADHRVPVDTFWDIGLPVNTVTWLVQITPQEIRVLDCIFEQDIGMADRIALMNAKGWPYRLHCFPHDSATRQASGLAQIDEFRAKLGPGCRVVPAVARVVHGIDLLKQVFPRMVFHKTRCKQALEYLSRYRAERETSTGIARDEPVHDRYSHPADALRQMAQAMERGLIPAAHVVGQAVDAHGSKPRVMTGFRR